jgi:hypothetical protein
MPIVIGNTTITGLGVGGLPANTVNSTTLADGAISRTKVGFQGAWLQLVHNFTDNTGTFNDQSTHLETFITPSAASSRILVYGLLGGNCSDDSVVRIQYKIGGGGWTTDTNFNANVQSFSGIGDLSYNHVSNDGPFPFGVIGYFHPNTTATVGIRFFMDVESTSTFYLNRSPAGEDGSENFGTSRTMLTLIEVRGP